MSALPLATQVVVWAFLILGPAAVAGNVAVVVAGFARGRHRAEEPLVVRAGRALHKVWRDLVDGFASGAEWLIYGARS